MTREDEVAALLDVYKLYDGDMSGFKLVKTPDAIRKFLRRNPSRAELNAAFFAILARIKRNERQGRPR